MEVGTSLAARTSQQEQQNAVVGMVSSQNTVTLAQSVGPTSDDGDTQWWVGRIVSLPSWAENVFLSLTRHVIACNSLLQEEIVSECQWMGRHLRGLWARDSVGHKVFVICLPKFTESSSIDWSEHHKVLGFTLAQWAGQHKVMGFA